MSPGFARRDSVCPHAALLCRPQKRPQDAREQVSMLVRIEVGDRNTGCLQLADLGGGLGLNFICIQTAQQSECAELADALAEARDRRRLDRCRPAGCGPASVEAGERRPPARRGIPRPVQAWIAPDSPLRKSPAVGHQRGRSHDAVFVGFHDGAIHARRETKIVGVDDQAAHRASLAGMCRVNATSPRLESSAGSCRLSRGRPALGSRRAVRPPPQRGTAA